MKFYKYKEIRISTILKREIVWISRETGFRKMLFSTILGRIGTNPNTRKEMDDLIEEHGDMYAELEWDE